MPSSTAARASADSPPVRLVGTTVETAVSTAMGVVSMDGSPVRF
ncbi:hypothetical protein ACIHCX_32900 [Streptomyces sp. NPDC052043]